MRLPFAPGKVLNTVSDLAHGITGIAGIIDNPTDRALPIATIGIGMMQPVYSSDWVLWEVWLFVLPEYRKEAPYFQDLFDFALWHRDNIASRVSQPVLPLELSVYSLERLPAKERLWRKNAVHVGSMFWAGL
jgi:hypothetical protein